MEFQENHSHGNPDRDQKLLRSASELPFIIDRLNETRTTCSAFVESSR
jgi:hypothetical protein